MPLYTRDPDAAQRAYAALEGRLGAALARAEAAERGAAAAEQVERDLAVLRQRVLDLEGELGDARERLEKVTQARADGALASVVGGVALAAELGEAAMPGRTIASLGVTLRGFVLPGDGVGLRLTQPGLAAAGTSTIAFDLARVPGDDAPAPRALYSVLEDKAAVYEGVREARELVAEIAQLLAAAGGWTLPLLAQASASIGRREAELAGDAEDLSSRAAELVRFAESIAGVAGDVAGLSTRLDATTRAAAAAFSAR
jgi:hypothetical protein